MDDRSQAGPSDAELLAREVAAGFQALARQLEARTADASAGLERRLQALEAVKPPPDDLQLRMQDLARHLGTLEDVLRQLDERFSEEIRQALEVISHLKPLLKYGREIGDAHARGSRSADRDDDHS